MADSKHTPGPWSVEDPMGADVGLWIVQSDLEPRQWSSIAIVTDDEDGQARDEGGRFIGRAEQEANARLIAAAPDMLAALKAFMAEHDDTYDGEPMSAGMSEFIDKARAAITTAEERS